MVEDNKPSERTEIIRESVKGAAGGAATAVLPYVVIIGLGIGGYLLLKDEINNAVGGLGDSANSVIDRIVENVTNINEYVTNTYNEIAEVIDKTEEKIIYGGEIGLTVDNGTFGGADLGKTNYIKKPVVVGQYPGLPAGNYLVKESDIKKIGGNESISISPDLSSFQKTSSSKTASVKSAVANNKYSGVVSSEIKAGETRTNGRTKYVKDATTGKYRSVA